MHFDCFVPDPVRQGNSDLDYGVILLLLFEVRLVRRQLLDYRWAEAWTLCCHILSLVPNVCNPDQRPLMFGASYM